MNLFVKTKLILYNITCSVGPDDTVIDKKNLIEEVSAGREISDMYLKHPANESSSDEEGTENEPEIGMCGKPLLLILFLTNQLGLLQSTGIRFPSVAL